MLTNVATSNTSTAQRSSYIYIVWWSSGAAEQMEQPQLQRSSKRSSHSHSYSYHSYHRYTNGHSKTSKSPQALTFLKTPLL